MFSNLEPQFEAALKEMKENGTYKEEKVLSGLQGPEIKVGERTLLNFCANNYLGLAGSEILQKAAKEGIDKYGFGMASVRFICGTSTVHKELEAEIAKFFGTEDAILYGSCFDANAGLFETILSQGDAVISDELNHASIIDGIRLCKADRFRYLHSDMADLEAKLKEAGERPRKLIVTDGVFSMDGETAKLKEICDLAEKYNAMVMVDDSHGSGVLGARGRGSVEGLMDHVDILTSTFGKALGGASGGFTAGPAKLVEYLRQRSRPYLFSNTLPVSIAHSALYVLRNFDGPLAGIRQDLAATTRHFREGMQKLGFTLGGDGTHPINPVMLPDEKMTMEIADALFEKDIYVRGFTYPVVPKGKPRIRVQISAAHKAEHVDRALQAFGEVGKKFGII